MIDNKTRDRPVQEYLGEKNDVLNDFDMALRNINSDVSKASSEHSRLLGAYPVLRAPCHGFETTSPNITLQRMCEYLDDLQATENKIITDQQFCSSTLHELPRAPIAIKKGDEFSDDLWYALPQFDIL